MHIVCPHCTTSYAINLATLGAAGRTVRCSRCKEVWLARPEDAIEAVAPVPAMAAAGQAGSSADAAAEWEALAREETEDRPPSSTAPRSRATGRRPEDDEAEDDWQSLAAPRAAQRPCGPGCCTRRGLLPPGIRSSACRPPAPRMGALVLALIDLARRRGAPFAADRVVLQDGRPRREPARADVQGRQDHHRNRRRQTGAGDRGRDRRRNQASRSNCRGCAFPFATPRAPKSMPGTRCWNSRC